MSAASIAARSRPNASDLSAVNVRDVERSVGTLDEPLHLCLRRGELRRCVTQAFHPLLEQSQSVVERQLLALQTGDDLLQSPDAILELHTSSLPIAAFRAAAAA